MAPAGEQSLNHPNSRAAYGVFLGLASKYNVCGLLRVPTELPQFNNRAELDATDAAIKCLKDMRDERISTTAISLIFQRPTRLGLACRRSARVCMEVGEERLDWR
jgi:hypothetical protein